MSELSPAVAIHLTAALAATVLGPLALWARKGHAQGQPQHPRLHRAFGYAWVTLMLLTAISALFIRSHFSHAVAGFSWIHLLIPLTVASLVLAFWRWRAATLPCTGAPCKACTSARAWARGLSRSYQGVF
jgi:uncharacterized membrane protein